MNILLVSYYKYVLHNTARHTPHDLLWLEHSCCMQHELLGAAAKFVRKKQLCFQNSLTQYCETCSSKFKLHKTLSENYQTSNMKPILYEIYVIMHTVYSPQADTLASSF